MKLNRRQLRKMIISEMRIGGGASNYVSSRNEISTNVIPFKAKKNPGVHFVIKSYIPQDYGSVKYMWFKDCTKNQVIGYKSQFVKNQKAKDWQGQRVANEPDDYNIVLGVDRKLHRVPIKKDNIYSNSNLRSSEDPTVYEIMGPYNNQQIEKLLNNPNYNWSGQSSQIRTYIYPPGVGV